MGPASLGIVMLEIDDMLRDQRQRQRHEPESPARRQRRWFRASIARAKAKPAWVSPSIADTRPR